MKTSKSRLLTVAIALLTCRAVLLGQGPPPGAGKPILTLQSNSVRASNLKPGGRVLFFGVDRVIDPDDYATVHTTRRIEVDSDNDGVVAIQLDHPVPARHVWLAVDLATGEEILDLPATTGQSRKAWRGRGLLRGPAGVPDAIETKEALLELALVRLEKGAWAGQARDGDQRDQDRAVNGTLLFSIEDLTPIGDSPPVPKTLEKGDWVIAVDPISMDLTLERVGPLQP